VLTSYAQNPDSTYVDIMKFVVALETRLGLLLEVKVSRRFPTCSRHWSDM
jgi:hypothetical protein